MIESVCFRRLLGKLNFRKDGFGWLEMSLVIYRKVVFEFKSLHETCKNIARFRIQKAFTKKVH